MSGADGVVFTDAVELICLRISRHFGHQELPVAGYKVHDRLKALLCWNVAPTCWYRSPVKASGPLIPERQTST